MKALVAVMSVLIVVATALVVGVIIHRLYARTTVPSIAQALPPPGAGPAVLPRGSRIAAVTAAGAFLAVSVTGPDGDAVWLIDPRNGAHSVLLAAPK